MPSVPSDDRGTEAVAPPRGESRAALIASARELFAAHGPGAVSARTIARNAGVNYGLIHRHFGSKEGLLRVVIHQLQDEMADQLQGTQDASGVPAGVATNEDLLRILGFVCLEGGGVDAFGGRHPIVDGARERVRPYADDADQLEVRTAVGTALTLGWIILQPFLRDATRIGDVPPDALNAELERALARAVGLPEPG